MIEIEQDDRVYIYSDGVIETCNPDKEMFGQQCLEDHFCQGPLPESALETINTSLETFRAGASQEDDTTMIEIICDAVAAGNFRDEATAINQEGGGGWNLSLQCEADSLRNIDIASYLIKIIEEYPELCSHKANIFMIITELVTNALDYGLFKLDPGLKNSLEGYERYIEARQKGFESINDGWLRIGLDYTPLAGGGKLVVQVEDSGPGFNYQKNFLAPADNLPYSGQGVALVRSMCTDFTYHGRGNRVQAVYRWAEESS